MADLVQDDPADAVTTHPASGSQPVQRDDKRGLLHMLHDEIGQRLGIGVPKAMRQGPQGQTLDEAVDEAVGQAKNANPDNP